MTSPLRYDPSFEQPEPDEADTTAELVATMRHIADITWKDEHHGLRTVHAKSHGLLSGELHVPVLPEELAQGAFARPGTFGAVMRFSTNPGDILDDAVSAPRGLALKLIGVAGERLPGSENEVTQDFVMANAPAFSAATPKKFLGSLKLLAKTTDTPQVFKKALSAVLRGVEAGLEAVGTKSVTAISLGGQPLVHILGETFYSQVPVMYGPYIAKVSVAPESAELTALTGQHVALHGRANALREEVAEFFRERGGTWLIRVQLCTDRDTMPVEDASVPWPEEESPYRIVGRLVVPPQTSWSDARSRAVDDGHAFSPWHGLADHRPLGGIMRARKPAYEMSSELRGERNGCPMHEPRTAPTLPD